MRHIIILLALLCVSCSSALPSLKPYRMDIQQGNVVTSKMIMQLRPGMTKSQVRFIMGTPLIQDTFHINRWDYFYQMRQQGKIIEQRRVILEFENEALARVRGDVIPAGSGQQDLATPATTPESLSKTDGAKSKKDEKGLVEKLKFWKSDEEEKKSDEQPAVLTAPAEQKTPAPASTAAEPEAKPAPAAPEASPATVPETRPDAGAGAQTEEDVPYVEPVQEPVEGKPISDSEPVAAPQAAPAEEKPVADTSPETDGSRSEAGDDSTLLMLDRSIDLPADTGNPSNVSNPSKAPDADLPSEASPEFFERMLEKIGF
jgi:outer membrane protein assembly factor BamE